MPERIRMTKMAEAAAIAAIGAATRELRLQVVRKDAARLAERSQILYVAFLAEVVSSEVDGIAKHRKPWSPKPCSRNRGVDTAAGWPRASATTGVDY
jgi:hypothetical protein